MNEMRRESPKRKRCRKLLLWMATAISAGLIYAFFCFYTGLFIPCMFRLFTGLRCPGCGISHMCLALLRLQFKEAFTANPAVLLMLPFLGILALLLMRQYVQLGKIELSKRQNLLVSIMVVFFVIFGIIRNLIGF